VGGIDTADLDPLTWHHSVGVLMQDPYWFNMSIRDNLRLANPLASVEDMWLACKRAAISNWIEQLPQGYDTVLGEHGTQLSGGQRHRLALARVILAAPPIVILDEATSELDPAAEQTVVAATRELARRATVIVVAHRLASVIAADRILVMDRGQLVADGSPAELRQTNAIYRALFSEQYSHYA